MEMIKLLTLILICITLGVSEGTFYGKRVHLHENFVVEERHWVAKVDAKYVDKFEDLCQERYDNLGDICLEGWEIHGEHLKVEVGAVYQSTVYINCGKVVRCKTTY